MASPAFPRSLDGFFRMFPDEESCLRYLVRARWPEGVACSRCGETGVCTRGDRRGGFECPSCGHVFSVTAGTVMENSKLPYSIWLQAAYLAVTDKRGISACQLQRDLGLRCYETAYMILQRLRVAMVNPDRERLHGAVEMDETFVGGVRRGARVTDRWHPGKSVVLGAIEVRGGEGPGWAPRRPARLRLRHVQDNRRANLVAFARDVVEPGTTVVTDGNPSYLALSREGLVHRVESTSLGMRQDAVLIHLHLAFSNLKAWLQGTFHGRVEVKHLQGYLNEFCFRFNRREDLHAAFRTTLGIATRVVGPTHRALYAEGPARFLHPNPHEGTAPYGWGSPATVR